MVALFTRWALPIGLQSTDPRSTTVGAEPCSTPVFNLFLDIGPDGIFATTTKIRARRRSDPVHTKIGTAGPLCPPTRRSPAPIAVAAAACCKARAVRWLGRHPFSEPQASAGELLHTPQRIPTFMATALLSIGCDVLCGFWV
jgi:hypothetical protein